MEKTIIISSLIIGLSILLSSDIYEYEYIGNEEKYSNEYLGYVINKKTGSVKRVSYVVIEDDNKEDVIQVITTDMKTGLRYGSTVD